MSFLNQLKLSNFSPTTKKAFSDLTLLAISQIFLFYGVKYILARADPSRQSKDHLLKKSKKVMKSMGLDKKTLELDDHEAMLIGEVIQPDEIDVGFSGLPYPRNYFLFYVYTFEDPPKVTIILLLFGMQMWVD
jgi:hypothetical protein